MFIIKKDLRDEDLLLKKFNNRDNIAFTQIYNLYYNDFHIYTKSLYNKTLVDSEDIIHDIFLLLWENKKLQFDSLLKIKAFVFIAIKNGYKNFINHAKYEEAYKTECDKDFKFDVIECQMYSIFEETMKLLPLDVAKIMEMYIDGYKPEEIAVKLNKNIQTIYNKKQEAIRILRNKLSKDKLLIISIIFNSLTV